MKNNKLTNFEYKILPSKVAGHKQICVTFDYRGDRISRFVFIKESKRTNYYKAARKIIEKEMKDKDLNHYAFWFRDSVHGNRVKAAIIIATSLVCASILGGAGYGIYHYITMPVIQFVKNNTKLINNVNKQEVICSKVEFGTHFEGTISTTNSDYDLPKEIYVTSGDKVLVEDTDYTYNETTGKFTTDVTSNLKIQLTPSCNVTSFVFDYPSYYSSGVSDNPGFRVVFEDGEDSGYVDWGIGEKEQISSSFIDCDYKAKEAPLKKYTVKIYGKIKTCLFNDGSWSSDPQANRYITDVHFGNSISTLHDDTEGDATVTLYRAQNVFFDKYSPITEININYYFRVLDPNTMSLVLPVNATAVNFTGAQISNFVDLKCYSKDPQPGYFVNEVTGHIYVPFGSEDAYKEVISQSAYSQMADLVTGFNAVLD